MKHMSFPSHQPYTCLFCLFSLVEYPYDDASLTFEPEGDTDTWCGEPTRPCADNCDSQSGSLESWDWCSTRMMTPRAAMGLRKLQKLLEMEGLSRD